MGGRVAPETGSGTGWWGAALVTGPPPPPLALVRALRLSRCLYASLGWRPDAAFGRWYRYGFFGRDTLGDGGGWKRLIELYLVRLGVLELRTYKKCTLVWNMSGGLNIK